MKINNKIPAVMVSNIHLRKALVEALRNSQYEIDEQYTENKIKDIDYGAFVLNDINRCGAGFGKMTPETDNDKYSFISIEKMLEILTPPAFEPVEVKLNDEYTAIIQQDGSVKVGCQTFTKDVLCKLLLEIEKVQAKN